SGSGGELRDRENPVLSGGAGAAQGAQPPGAADREDGPEGIQAQRRDGEDLRGRRQPRHRPPGRNRPRDHRAARGARGDRDAVDGGGRGAGVTALFVWLSGYWTEVRAPSHRVKRFITFTTVQKSRYPWGA